MLHTAKWLAIGIGYLIVCAAAIPFLPLLWAYIRLDEWRSRAIRA